jgi:hypothetical protein
MAEPLADRYNIHPGRDQRRGVTVTECVEHDPRQLSVADQIPRIPRQLVGGIGRVDQRENVIPGAAFATASSGRRGRSDAEPIFCEFQPHLFRLVG